MNGKFRYFTLGIFVLVGIGLGIFGLISLGSDALKKPTLFLETYVDESVQGVDIGTPFKFRGVKLGSVHSIDLVSEEYDTDRLYVMLRVAIDESELDGSAREFGALVSRQVANGLRVKMVPQGITGLSYLDTDFMQDGLSEPLEIDWDPRNIYIPSSPSIMSVLSRSVEKITAQVNTIDLGAIGANIESITKNLNLSVQHIESITADIAASSEGIVGDVEKAVGNLPVVSEELGLTVIEMRKIVQDSGGEMDQILSNVRYISEETRELVRMIKRSPGVLLTKPPVDKFKE